MVDQRNISTAKEELQDDLPSVKGQFWWVTLGKHHLPCLKKSDGTKYVSVRMAEMKVLNFFLNYLNSDVCSCYSVKSFGMTEPEANLLNVINVRHSESMFGHEEFTVNNDFIVKLSDLIEFHAFIETCYNKLLLRISNKDDRCGFIRINNDSVVPYTLKNDMKYVPLFYFEGETDTLKKKAKQLDSWDLAYLKFCCKVQGIKNELFASETCLVTSLDDIKSYFPDGTTFEDYWPSKVNDMQIPKKNNANSHSWVRAPNNEMVPSSVITSVAVAAAAASAVPSSSVLKAPNQRVAVPVNNANLPSYQSTWPVTLVGTAPSYQSTVVSHRTQPQNSFLQPRVQQPQISAVNNAQPRTYMQQQQPIRPQLNNQYYSSHQSNAVLGQQSQVQQQSPVVRVTLTNTIGGTYSVSTAGSCQNMYNGQNGNALPQLHQIRYTPTGSLASPVVNHENSVKQQQQQRLNMMNNNTSAAYVNRFPPALTPINATNSSMGQLTPASSTSAANQRKRTVAPLAPSQQVVGNEVIDLCSSPPPNSPQLAPVNYTNRSQINGCGPHNNNRRSWNLLKISEETNTSCSASNPMYKVQTTSVKDKSIRAINFRPFSISELLVSVDDLMKVFFPKVAMPNLQEVLQVVLKINLYAANSQQMKVLAENGMCQNVTDIIPLISIKDVDTFFPHLEYVLNKSAAAEADQVLVKKRKAS